MLGAFQKSGRITIEKDAGDRVGHRMTGGEIIVQGSVGDETAAEMKGGFVIVRGHADCYWSGHEWRHGCCAWKHGNDPGRGMVVDA